MHTLTRYVSHRYFSKKLGFGEPWIKPLWLDAILFGLRRYFTWRSQRFKKWCDEVDLIFCKHHEWPRQYTIDTGRDCWIDFFWDGMSPEDAVAEEVSNWDS